MEDRSYNPNPENTPKKNQTVLLINNDESVLNLDSLKERYEIVKHFNEDHPAIDADFLKGVITKSTKGKNENKKLKIVIGDHGSKYGQLKNEKFILKTLKGISKEIKKHNENPENAQEQVKNIDMVLNSCYASKVVRENAGFKDVLKSFTNENIDVRVSAGDQNFAASNIIGNNKNILPISKTEGHYAIDEFRFNIETDFDEKIEPHRTKEYKTVEDFMKDEYVGKNEKENISESPLEMIMKGGLGKVVNQDKKEKMKKKSQKPNNVLSPSKKSNRKRNVKVG